MSEIVGVTDLAAWLTTQLDADEWIADVISGGGYAPDMWEIEPSRSVRWSQIAAWGPQRVMDEIDAKRAVLALHVLTEYHGCAVCDRDDESCGCLGGGVEYPCRTIKFLALPYADRPGYRDEWRP